MLNKQWCRQHAEITYYNNYAYYNYKAKLMHVLTAEKLSLFDRAFVKLLIVFTTFTDAAQ